MMNRFCSNLALACLIGIFSPFLFAQSNQSSSESNDSALTAHSSDQEKFLFLLKNYITHTAQTSPSLDSFGTLDIDKIPNEILLDTEQSKQLILVNTFPMIELHQLLTHQNTFWPFSERLIASMSTDTPYDLKKIRICYLQKMTPEYVKQYYLSLADTILKSGNEKQVRAQLSYIYYGQQLPVLKKANNELLKDLHKRLNEYRKTNSKYYGKNLDIELLPDVFKTYRYQNVDESDVPAFFSFAQHLFIPSFTLFDQWKPLNMVLPLTPEITSQQYLRLSATIFKSCGVDINIENF
ncbi:hypothetical protein F4V57_13735 [Acinetobacter qingfengensis]|uniref:Uncharacterized protein n=1 Tax=Acinetobacter qingfengensis TaxID=1262585 RepID=A0A1E7REZ6_9GAMM|nr:hypothetical protein [Acinetobacter qingfengensis]KAA8731138.1 hypothetical protein F4V57_13735 [Acinetobacter qingfengensis]OEY97807.1 hypothetical protein BJI46_07865 [Acinetobacter qingfengensis]